MSISIQCPGCDKRLKAKDELAGKQVKCPACGCTQTIPHPDAPPLTSPLTEEDIAAFLTAPPRGSINETEEDIEREIRRCQQVVGKLTSFHTPEVRASLLEELVNHGPRAEEALVRSLHDRDARRRGVAIEVLGEMKGTGAIDVLCKLLTGQLPCPSRYTPDPKEQDAVAKAIAAIGGEEVRAELLRLIMRGYVDSACKVLALIDPEEAARQLAKEAIRMDAVRKEMEQRRHMCETEARQSIAGKTDSALIFELVKICQFWGANQHDESGEKSFRAHVIGEEFNDRGGFEKMQWAFDKLEGMSGSRALEMEWGGIGKWRG